MLKNKKEDEILLIAQEECAEVTQAISKIFRFGFDAKHPKEKRNNRERLEEELGDLLAMVELITDNNVGITVEGLETAKKNKFKKLKKWSNLTINK